MRYVSVLGLILAGATSVLAQSTPYAAELVANGFARPLAMENPGSDTSRLLIIEQTNADIEVLDLDTGMKLPTPFLDLTGSVSTNTSERGLLGLAVHPDYDSNGYVYVNYTNNSGNTVVRRFTTDPSDENKALPASGLTIITISQPQSNHNAGGIQFGPDGMLWICNGDGGNANDSGSGHAAGGNAQSGATLLGKIIRIDVDNPSGGNNYGIPADNPFVSNGSVLDEIWAFGVRNPWRFRFDGPTGDLWIGDVGQDPFGAAGREEVNHIPGELITDINAGTKPPLNLGWRCREGFSCTGLSGCTCPSASLYDPIVDYSWNTGQSVCGATVYRGDAIPDLKGTIFYGDYNSNRFWELKIDDSHNVISNTQITTPIQPGGGLNLQKPTDFYMAGDGELYISDRNGGEIFRLRPTGDFLGLGSELAGAAGDPVLFGTGSVAPGQPGAMHLRGAASSSLAAFFVGTGTGAIPFKLGTLVTDPLLLTIVVSTDGNGEIDLAWTDLGPNPSGVSLTFQWGIQDAGAPAGVALSNGLRATIP